MSDNQTAWPIWTGSYHSSYRYLHRKRTWPPRTRGVKAPTATMRGCANAPACQPTASEVTEVFCYVQTRSVDLQQSKRRKQQRVSYEVARICDATSNLGVETFDRKSCQEVIWFCLQLLCHRITLPVLSCQLAFLRCLTCTLAPDIPFAGNHNKSALFRRPQRRQWVVGVAERLPCVHAILQQTAFL